MKLFNEVLKLLIEATEVTGLLVNIFLIINLYIPPSIKSIFIFACEFYEFQTYNGEMFLFKLLLFAFSIYHFSMENQVDFNRYHKYLQFHRCLLSSFYHNRDCYYRGRWLYVVC